jgi:hypothetical protein
MLLAIGKDGCAAAVTELYSFSSRQRTPGLDMATKFFESAKSRESIDFQLQRMPEWRRAESEKCECI